MLPEDAIDAAMSTVAAQVADDMSVLRISYNIDEPDRIVRPAIS
jgi:hypothetical protein